MLFRINLAKWWLSVLLAVLFVGMQLVLAMMKQSASLSPPTGSPLSQPEITLDSKDTDDFFPSSCSGGGCGSGFITLFKNWKVARAKAQSRTRLRNFFRACEAGNVNAVSSFLLNGRESININTANPRFEDRTCLMNAAIAQNGELVSFLLDKGGE